MLWHIQALLRKKLENVSLRGLFFLYFWRNAFLKCPRSTKSPLVWNFLVVRLRSVLILLVKHSILNVWQCSECFCLDNCSVIYTVTPCYVLHQTDSEFWRIQNSFCSDMYSYNPERNIFRHIHAIKTYSHKGHYI